MSEKLNMTSFPKVEIPPSSPNHRQTAIEIWFVFRDCSLFVIGQQVHIIIYSFNFKIKVSVHPSLSPIPYIGWKLLIQFILPSLALASSLALAEAELVIVLQNPATRPPIPPSTHPPSKVWQSLNRAILRKQKLIVYMRRPQNSFWTLPGPENRPN